MKINFSKEHKHYFKAAIVIVSVLVIFFMAVFIIIKSGTIIFRDPRTYEQKLEDYLVRQCDDKTYNPENKDQRFIECIDGVKQYMEERKKYD